MSRRFLTLLAAVILAGPLTFVAVVSSASAKPIELKFSYWMPTTHSMHQEIFVPWKQEIEKQTNGAVTITLYPGGALGKAADHHDMVTGGVCDIAYIIQSYTAGRFPLTSVMSLPFLYPTSEIGTRIVNDIYPEYLKREYDNVKVMFMWAMAPAQLHMTHKPVHELKDLKGAKMRTPGAYQAAIVKDLGATSLSMPITDVYSSLEKGVADGAVLPWEVIKPFKFQEVLKYHTITNLYGMANGVVMNLEAWHRLPAKTQDTIKKINSRFVNIAAKVFDANEQVGRKICEEAGQEIYDLPKKDPREFERWRERVSGLYEKWISDMDAKGLPGKEIVDRVRSLSKQYD